MPSCFGKAVILKHLKDVFWPMGILLFNLVILLWIWFNVVKCLILKQLWISPTEAVIWNLKMYQKVKLQLLELFWKNDSGGLHIWKIWYISKFTERVFVNTIQRILSKFLKFSVIYQRLFSQKKWLLLICRFLRNFYEHTCFLSKEGCYYFN